MDIEFADKFVYRWDMRERGRSEGVANAIAMIDGLME